MVMSSLPARTRIFAVGEVRLKPLMPDTRDNAPRRDLLVAEFPFGIGHKPLRHEQTPRTEMPPMLIDNKPHSLSRSHVVVEHGHVTLMVRDVRCYLCNEVNGERIWEDNTLNAMVLRMGENGAAACGHGALFQFLIKILP